MKFNKTTLRLLIAATIVALLPIKFTAARQVRDDRPRELAGISSSESFQYKDDLELDLDADVVVRMLYRLRKASPATIEHFSNYAKDTTWQNIVEETIDYRFWLFGRKAVLHHVEKIEIDAPNTPDSIRHFYRCECTTDNGSGESANLILLTRSLPKALRLAEQLNEPIMFRGLLYCRAVVDMNSRGERNTTVPVFIADGLSWFPNQPNNTDPHLVELAQNGFDVGLLDKVQASNGRALGRNDREAFFEMMTAVGKHSAQNSEQASIPLESIIATSGKHIGSRVRIVAPCRECTRLEVADPDIQKRFGIDHYFQLILFPDFDKPIVLTEDRDGKTNKVSIDRYPVTVCCSRLPEGLTPEDIRKNLISVDGTFFRIWKYQSELTKRSNVSGTISPLIMAAEPAIEESNFWLNDLVTWVFTGCIAMILGLYCYYRIFAGKRFRRSETVLDQLPDKIDVSGLE